MKTHTLLLIATTLFVLLSCNQDKQAPLPEEESYGQGAEKTLEAADPLLELLGPDQTGIYFANQIVEDMKNNMVTNPNIYNGGGVAVADVNNDGLPDLYFIGSAGKNRLYLNEGRLKFRDVTDQAGLGAEGGFKTAVTAADVNADGFLDFYVCRAGVGNAPEIRRNLLFINNGDLTFTEKAAEYGIDDPAVSTGAVFFDMDLDGDLDLYVLNSPASYDYINNVNSVIDKKTGKYAPKLTPRDPMDTDRLYRNNGKGAFTDVSEKAGIWNLGYGLSVGVADFNADGWPDVYVGNDYIQPDRLYVNNRNGTFTDRLPDYFDHTSQHTMGSDLNDFDNDGLVDVFALDMLPVSNFRRKTTTNTNSQTRHKALTSYGYFEPVVRNVLQRNNGNGTFSEIACLSGVYKTDWSWGCLFFDMDNDGLKDLAISNGFRREVTDADFIAHVYNKLDSLNRIKPFRTVEDFLSLIPSYKIRNFVFQNKGEWAFEEMSGKWLTAPATWSNGSVYADLDADGDLEYIVSNLDEPALVYANRTVEKKKGNYLQIRLEGDRANLFAVGATATVYAGGKKQWQPMQPTRGIFSSVEHLLHFGLGKTNVVDSLVVQWPDGRETRMYQVKANQRLALKAEDAQKPGQSQASPLPAFTAYTESGIDFSHKESPFDDFESQFLKPWRLTELGPAMASADVNGDGLEDFFVGNAFNEPSGLFIQQKDGRFVRGSAPTFEQEKAYEAHGSLFFDADGDGDQDLFVVGGGSNSESELAWQPRLFLNDGQGNFARAPEGSLPATRDLGMQAVAHDFDRDGDQDLFIGGRVVPNQYPATPRSLVFRNEGGKFTDVTEAAGGDFARCGMVTDLQWIDLDGKGEPVLVAVGEWMPVSIFSMKNGKLTDVTRQYGLEFSNGFWNALAAADLDGDGDQDLVTGNFGLNSAMTADKEAPMLCYAKDFDGNGSMDPVLAYFEKGRCYPYRQRDVMIQQLPMLKKKFVYYKDYGKAQITDLFEEEALNSAIKLAVYTLHTSWWENRGGKLVQHPLPVQAQVSPVMGICVEDFNRDGKPDIFLVGNKYGVEVETGRQDAGSGCLLLNRGKGDFAWQPNTGHGLWAQKEARSVLCLAGADRKRIVIVGNNNSELDVYKEK